MNSLLWRRGPLLCYPPAGNAVDQEKTCRMFREMESTPVDSPKSPPFACRPANRPRVRLGAPQRRGPSLRASRRLPFLGFLLLTVACPPTGVAPTATPTAEILAPHETPTPTIP